MDGREVLWLVPVLGVVVLFTLPSPLPMSVRPFVDVSRFVETALNPYGGFDDQVVSFPPATDLIEKTYPTFVRAQRRARGAEEAEELLFGECSIQLPNQRRFITALAESRQLRFDPVPELVLCYGQLGGSVARFQMLKALFAHGDQRRAKGRRWIVLRVNR